MTKDEKIILVVVALLIMAVIIWRKPIVAAITGDDEPMPQVDEIGVSQTPNKRDMKNVRAYLSYNLPYAFSPPVGNFLPSQTAGQVGQTVNKPTNFDGYWLN